MTTVARDWLATFADEAIMADLLAAAEACMRDGCAGHDDGQGGMTTDPERCDCRANLMTPVEVVEWIRLKERTEGDRPTQLRRDHRDHMSEAASERWRRTRLETARAV